MQSLPKDSGDHWDSNSQNGGSLGSVKVHSLTFFYTHGSMRCDSRASLLACNLASLCLGHEPKARVTTTPPLIMKGFQHLEHANAIEEWKLSGRKKNSDPSIKFGMKRRTTLFGLPY